MDVFAFCEPVWASTQTRVHIRKLNEGAELKLGGGIDTPTLCGKLAYYGWDLPGEVTFESIGRTLEAEVNPTCRDCAQKWAYATGVQEDPDPRAWMRAKGRPPAPAPEGAAEPRVDEALDVGF